MNHKHKAIAISGILAVFLVAGAPAQAERLEVQSNVVRFGDLDLTSEAGIERLYRRIDAAAERVCGNYDQRNLGQRAAWKHCYSAAVDAAVARVGLPQLSQLHELKKPGRV